MICSSATICSFGCRALLKAAISSSACDTPSPRIWIGSLFFAGIEKAPLAFSAFLVVSHHRFHSASVKTSPISHSPICCVVALPSKLSRMFRTSAAGFSLAKFLIDARSVATREKMLWRERREILRRVLSLHWMGLLAGKIDHDLIEQQVPFAHATESPALVQTKSARL